MNRTNSFESYTKMSHCWIKYKIQTDYDFMNETLIEKKEELRDEILATAQQFEQEAKNTRKYISR